MQDIIHPGSKAEKYNGTKGQLKEFRPEPGNLPLPTFRIFFFSHKGPLCPERHLEGAELLGYENIRTAHRKDAGKILSDVMRGVMDKMKVPNGLKALGYTNDDIPGLVKGALPQVRSTL